MRVFVTGAAGFIGKAMVPELLKNGHQVLGLARSDKSADVIKQLGAEVHRGDLADLESLRAGAKATDGIIHLAFGHDFNDFSKWPAFCAADRAAISAMAEANEGTGKPLVIATGTLAMPPGTLATEDMDPLRDNPLSLRMQSEDLIRSLSREKNIRGSVVRLSPTVHGPGDAAFIPIFIDSARKNRAASYVGDGSSRWPAVHRADAAILFRLALEKGVAGAAYHAVAEQGVSTKAIMTLIGKKLDVPTESISAEEAGGKLGFLGHLVGIDNPVSSEATRKELGWQPTYPGLLADMEENYF